MTKLEVPNPRGYMNEFTTHPRVRARRQGALDRLNFSHPTAVIAGGTPKEVRREVERAALVRKLGQRKQGSAK